MEKREDWQWGEKSLSPPITQCTWWKGMSKNCPLVTPPTTVHLFLAHRTPRISLLRHTVTKFGFRTIFSEHLQGWQVNFSRFWLLNFIFTLWRGTWQESTLEAQLGTPQQNPMDQHQQPLQLWNCIRTLGLLHIVWGPLVKTKLYFIYRKKIEHCLQKDKLYIVDLQYS